MDELHWNGELGWSASGNTRHTLMMNPISTVDAIDYSNGAGIMTVGGVTETIDAPTLTLVAAYLLTVAAFDSAPAPQVYGVDANGNYLGLVPATTAHTILPRAMPDGIWKLVNDVWVETVLLADAQNLASAQIDTAAGAARLRYITDVPGQQAVYLEKLQQSQAWVANPTGTPPPYVAAEAAAMQTDNTSAANYIIATANAWGQQLSPAIEQYRRAGKIAVAAAGTNADVAKQLAASLAIINSI